MRRAVAGDLPERHAGQLLGFAERFAERFSFGQPVRFAQRIASTLRIAFAIAVTDTDTDTAAGHTFTPAHTHVDVRDGRGQPVHGQRRATPARWIHARIRHPDAS
jgi:hypothetical protein